MLMKHMHQPDSKLSPEQPDRRMVVILRDGRYRAGSTAPANSKDFTRQYPAKTRHG